MNANLIKQHIKPPPEEVGAVALPIREGDARPLLFSFSIKWGEHGLEDCNLEHGLARPRSRAEEFGGSKRLPVHGFPRVLLPYLNRIRGRRNHLEQLSDGERSVLKMGVLGLVKDPLFDQVRELRERAEAMYGPLGLKEMYGPIEYKIRVPLLNDVTRRDMYMSMETWGSLVSLAKEINLSSSLLASTAVVHAFSRSMALVPWEVAKACEYEYGRFRRIVYGEMAERLDLLAFGFPRIKGP